jgi:hypothetical protein
LNSQDSRQESIFQRIATGELAISSKKEYADLLTLFPDKADIQRAYADFLTQQGEDETACQYYLSAADLYIKDGKTIQAIVSKILAWRIIKPTHQEGRAFHAALQAGLSGETPLHHFFEGMPYPEFIAIMLRLVRLQLSAGETIIKAGDKSDDIYFIVYGDMEETLPPTRPEDAHASGVPSRLLSDNDIFGEVFPLSETNFSRSDVKTLTHTELVKISKSALIEISRKYPLIEKLLTKAYKDPSGQGQNRSWVSVRRSVRHMAPVKINLKIIFAKQPENILAIDAVSKDISLGGVCIDMGLTHGGMPIKDIIGAKAGVTIDLPNIDKSLSINGTIVWGKKLEEPAGVSILAGIKFDDMDRETNELLNVYCFGIDNEQALMWSLWENTMGK